MERIAIFCFYDSDGIVYNYVNYYLEKIKKVVKKLVIVVNGEIKQAELKKLEIFTSDIYIRKNIGFDAGAYKECMLNYVGVDKMKMYDELVLCNDTCFGPLIDFSSIFAEMEKNDCDFWGLKRIEGGWFSHLQSYFLVFKKNIISRDVFYDYFKYYIDEKSTCIYDVYGSFEQGIYRMLLNMGFKSACYGKSGNLNNYKSAYDCLIKGDILVKKKIFSLNNTDTILTINYIKEQYEYDINYILQIAEKKYNYINTIEQKVPELAEKIYFDKSCVNEKDILCMCKGKKVYIYGAGEYAYRMYHFLKYFNIEVVAFLVSDIRKQVYSQIHGILIQEWKEQYNESNVCVIVCMNYKNSKEIYDKFSKNNIFLWLWDMV